MARACKPGGKSICSDIVDNMWCLEIQPKERTFNTMRVYLTMLYMPSNEEILKIGYTIKCIELGEDYEGFWNFLFDDASFGPGSWINLSQIGNLERITFKADIEIKYVSKYKTLTALTRYHPSDIAYLLAQSH